MPKKMPVQQPEETFGFRLARLRHKVGLTQQELGDQIGLSQRMVAYYEGQSARAPDHLLAAIAEVLGVSTDELLGVKSSSGSPQKPSNQRLWRRFRQIEKLPPRDRRQLLAMVDAMLERHRLLQKAS